MRTLFFIYIIGNFLFLLMGLFIHRFLDLTLVNRINVDIGLFLLWVMYTISYLSWLIVYDRKEWI